MKKKAALAALFAAALMAVPTPSHAHTYIRDDSGHPLRLVAYALHPFGVALEYLVTRPVHMLVSANEDTAIIFGHDRQPDDVFYVWDEPGFDPEDHLRAVE